MSVQRSHAHVRHPVRAITTPISALGPSEFQRVAMARAPTAASSLSAAAVRPVPGEASTVAVERAEPGTARRTAAATRALLGIEETELSADARVWLACLDESLRPRELERQYPRIVNRLAQLWREPARCTAYLDALVFPDRVGRQGFPPVVAQDIARLRVHVLREIHPLHETIARTDVPPG